MYRVDVYRSMNIKKSNGSISVTKKKLSSHWYPTEKEAKKASDAIYQMPFGTYVYVPREGRPPIARDLGGYSTSKPINDNRF